MNAGEKVSCHLDIILCHLPALLLLPESNLPGERAADETPPIGTSESQSDERERERERERKREQWE